MTANQKMIVASFHHEAPVDITAMATALGLVVYNDFDLPPGVSGKIVRDDARESREGFMIAVNANEAYVRRRFTVAHECAHFLLHRDRIGDGITDDPLYRSETMNSREEIEANNKAADLLMPRHLVNKAVRVRGADPEMLAREFVVSPAAMRARLRYLYST